MYIETLFPQVIASINSLVDQIMLEAKELKIDDEIDLISNLPSPLIGSNAFLDKMTNLWRYEFGVPYEFQGSLLWGTHMWVPVTNLIKALLVVHNRLSDPEKEIYFKRLNIPGKHLEALVEMIPGDKIAIDVPIEFEVQGYGSGNKTIDWLIKPDETRNVLIDVKRRMTDFIHHMRDTDEPDNVEHDHELLFRSIEDKFITVDSNEQLQGVWIVTDIKQNKDKLISAFHNLDASKVHFAILGDWRDDALILSHNENDSKYLSELFQIGESTRYIVE